MKKFKKVPCTVCDGKGYVLWANTTEPSCSTGSKTCPHCRGTGQREVPMTNADRIRAMSDEELAYFLKCCMYNDFKPPCKKSTFFSALHRPDCEENCTECICEWLQQPAEDKEAERNELV